MVIITSVSLPSFFIHFTRCACGELFESYGIHSFKRVNEEKQHSLLEYIHHSLIEEDNDAGDVIDYLVILD